jgi:excisionase family DNA binding protein
MQASALNIGPVHKRAFRMNEYCAAYGLSRSTAYKLIREGKLRAVKVGGRRLIPKEAAEALLTGANR